MYNGVIHYHCSIVTTTADTILCFYFLLHLRRICHIYQLFVVSLIGPIDKRKDEAVIFPVRYTEHMLLYYK